MDSLLHFESLNHVFMFYTIAYRSKAKLILFVIFDMYDTMIWDGSEFIIKNT